MLQIKECNNQKEKAKMMNNRLNSLEMNLRNKEEKVMLMKVQLKNLNI